MSNPQQGPALAKERDCLKDQWTLELQRQFPTLSGAEFQAVLQLQALIQPLDIGEVESRHASIRRQVVQHSVQTWRMAFSQASCEWMMQNFRIAGKKHKAQLKKPSGEVGGLGSVQ